MKIAEVPQDNDPSFEGQRKLCYAVNDQGQYVTTQTTGWEVESVVKDLAWDVIRRDLARTERAVHEGRASRLELFMKRRQMEPTLLAQNMGVSAWRVRWHLRPWVFRRLSEKWLTRYAECLNVSVAQLLGSED